MRRATVVPLALAALVALVAPIPAHADGLLISASGGYLDLNFKESAKAVTGSSGGGAFGGDIGYIFRDHLFFTVGARAFNTSGERVFVADPGSRVFKLGHPLKLRLVPAQATLGWRFGPKRVLNVPLTPYLGIGAGVTSYREESTVAGETRTFEVSKAGAHGLVGLEFGGGRLRFGIEASYSSVPDAIGESPDGVSKVYGENDIGGTTVLGKIVFTTSKR